jgi:diaminopropionate ammonia-lyase
MLLHNPRATRQPYPPDLRSILSVARAEESRRWLASWPGIARGPTPLHALDGLAGALGVGAILVKDESVRSELCSFKALGAPAALARLILRLWPDADMDPARVLAGEHASRLRDITVICATDGNHGRALAAAAGSVGCKCVIVLHANVVLEREAAIAAYGANIVRIEGNYDQSVAEAARLARVNGWHVVSDTSYAGDETIPRDVMQGYAILAAEVVEALPGASPRRAPITHAFVQGGVGGLAAGVVSCFWEIHGDARPTFVIVEPRQADCLYQSARRGRPAKATGSVDSIMAGLACGEASPLAWRFLEPAADFFMTVADEDAVEAMRLLARGNATDPPLVSGESGAAGAAALLALTRSPRLAAQVGLGRDSTVLLVNTEGATAPGVYRELVGEDEASVLGRQRAFFDRRAGLHRPRVRA